MGIKNFAHFIIILYWECFYELFNLSLGQRDWITQFDSRGSIVPHFFPSFRNVFFDLAVRAVKPSKLFEIDLAALASTSSTGFLTLRGHLTKFSAFQMSINSICPFILFTDNISIWESRVSVLILSFRVTLFRNLASLFWTFWISFRSCWWMSESFSLTLPNSWRPFQIFKLNQLPWSEHFCWLNYSVF